jgi:hypothetical protein
MIAQILDTTLINFFSYNLRVIKSCTICSYVVSDLNEHNTAISAILNNRKLEFFWDLRTAWVRMSTRYSMIKRQDLSHYCEINIFLNSISYIDKHDCNDLKIYFIIILDCTISSSLIFENGNFIINLLTIRFHCHIFYAIYWQIKQYFIKEIKRLIRDVIL